MEWKGQKQAMLKVRALVVCSVVGFLFQFTLANAWFSLAMKTVKGLVRSSGREHSEQDSCINEAMVRAKGSGTCATIPLNTLTAATSEVLECLIGSSRENVDEYVGGSAALFEVVRSDLRTICQHYHEKAVHSDAREVANNLQAETSKLASVQRELLSVNPIIANQATQLDTVRKSLRVRLAAMLERQTKTVMDIEKLTVHVEKDSRKIDNATKISLSQLGTLLGHSLEMATSLKSALCRTRGEYENDPPTLADVFVPFVHMLMVFLVLHYLQTSNHNMRQPTYAEAQIAIVPALADVSLSLCFGEKSDWYALRILLRILSVVLVANCSLPRTYALMTSQSHSQSGRD